MPAAGKKTRSIAVRGLGNWTLKGMKRNGIYRVNVEAHSEKSGVWRTV